VFSPTPASSVAPVTSQVVPEGLSDFAVFANTSLQVPITTAQTSLVNEPTVAQRNQLVFYTGNWYAARSANGGTNWSYINPQSDMPDFCCDQDTLYNPTSGIFIWYRMGRPQTNLTNRFFLGVSTDASTWYIYKIHPTTINPSWTSQIFDFVIMAYSSNYLYITNNLFQNQTYTNSLIIRLSLANLKSHSAFTFNYYATKNDGFAPVQGAKTTMYFAAHVNTNSLYTNTLRLYIWNEGSTTLSIPPDIVHSAYKVTNPGDATCQAPDQGDICKRLDDRILGGWVSKGVIGFVWSVAQGSVAGGTNYGYPYTYVLRINETLKTNMDFGHEPVLANPNYAWVYAWISPNGRGDLGAVAFTAGPTRFPTLDVGILDSYSGSSWQFEPAATSSNGPQTSCSTASGFPCWGDFIRVHPFNGTSNAWVASGYILQGGRSGEFVQPRYVVFGRLGDNPFNNATITFLTLPSVVGSITFNGTTYKNGQSGLYNVSTTYKARLNLPQFYNFYRWNATGGVSVSDPLANPTNVTIIGPGYLTGVMIPPNVTINFFTSPANLGSITCSEPTYTTSTQNGQTEVTFTDGQTGRLPANSTISCTANVPAGYHFVAWSGLSSATTSSIGLFTHNGGSLTAYFAVGASATVTPIGTLTIGLVLILVLLAGRRLRRVRFSSRISALVFQKSPSQSS
jgi:hypothetical protein